MARHVPIAPRAGRGPLVLGHRGASADAPENTLAAFRLALEQGADGVELDVWRCGTGEVVVGHDEDTLRVSGVALRVPDAPLAELRALDVGGWKGDAFRGERMPLLSEVLEELPGAVVNVELKSRGGDLRLAGAVAKVVARAGAAGRVLVSSFDWRLVVAFRLAAPDVPVGLLFDGERSWKLPLAAAIRLMGPSAVHPERTLATEERVRAWTRRGLAVNVWTVDDPAEARALAALGAAGVISNVPARIRAALG
jgi:glycerophosphoryl diester phosphodiesterase